MKNIMRVVLLFDTLQERVQIAIAPIELRPEWIGQHIFVRIVDVAAFVVLAWVRRAGEPAGYVFS